MDIIVGPAGPRIAPLIPSGCLAHTPKDLGFKCYSLYWKDPTKANIITHTGRYHFGSRIAWLSASAS